MTLFLPRKLVLEETSLEKTGSGVYIIRSLGSGYRATRQEEGHWLVEGPTLEKPKVGFDLFDCRAIAYEDSHFNG